MSENKTGELYALKVLRKDNVIKRNQVEHTRTERSVLGYVKHPFIVGMNMAFQSKDKLYFVLDYCPGGELFFHLGKVGKFPEPRARFYAAEIILAISYVHSLDIVYRDVSTVSVCNEHSWKNYLVADLSHFNGTTAQTGECFAGFQWTHSFDGLWLVEGRYIEFFQRRK